MEIFPAITTSVLCDVIAAVVGSTTALTYLRSYTSLAFSCLLWPILPCPVFACIVMYYHALPCLALPYLALPALPCLVLSYLVLSRLSLDQCLVLYCLVLSCLVLCCVVLSQLTSRSQLFLLYSFFFNELEAKAAAVLGLLDAFCHLYERAFSSELCRYHDTHTSFSISIGS